VAAVTRRRWRGAILALALTPGLAWAQTAARPADLVVLNGKVVTVDARASVAQAVAIRDGRIVAVGSTASVRRFQGSATRVIDAGGRTVIPGLIDTHVHALMAARVEAVTPFRTLSSVHEIQAWIRAEAQRTPAPAWIWTTRVFPTRVREGRFPTRQELDAAAPGRAVVVDGSYAFVLSTAALEAAGITAQTPDPAGAAIVRGAEGAPTGLLRNAGAMLAKFRPTAGAAAPLDQIEALHRVYLQSGITSIGERAASVDGYRTYEALKQAGRLHVRATVTIQLPMGLRAADAARVIDALPLAPRAGDDRLKVGPLKLTVDGGILLGTSYMNDPYGPQSRALYGDQGEAYRGFLSTPPEAIRAVMAAGHARGWQMAAHVTGDAGVDVVLDAFEAAQAAHPRRDPRHTLIHAYFPTPAAAARTAALGVQVDTQPAWFYKDTDALLDALGPGRLSHFIGLRTWRAAGVRVAINTDHMFGADRDTAMNPFNPFLTMATAVMRKTEAGRVVGLDEAVTREQALRMMTIDAAALSFDERDRGSIEVGKLGDLAILSDDLLTCPADRLRHIEADITIVGGLVVHQGGKGARLPRAGASSR
jgi:predicted amidohydrolase YtcJ